MLHWKHEKKGASFPGVPFFVWGYEVRRLVNVLFYGIFNKRLLNFIFVGQILFNCMMFCYFCDNLDKNRQVWRENKNPN